MKELYIKLQKNLGLSLILLIGLSVEFSNFRSMFVRFMAQYRPDWGAINHIPAMFLSAFLLLCIVIFGIRKQTALSWFLAMLTCVISFAVYSRMNLSWQWEQMTEVHFVVLILSGMLPMLVAYTTHQIAYDQEFFFDDKPINRHDRAEMERLMREIRKMHTQNMQQVTAPQTTTYQKKNAAKQSL
jgi:Kef-type K+ transport system membrane component KefB